MTNDKTPRVKCARPHCKDEEFRINGYCSIYCQDIDEVDQQLRDARDELSRASDHAANLGLENERLTDRYNKARGALDIEMAAGMKWCDKFNALRDAVLLCDDQTDITKEGRGRTSAEMPAELWRDTTALLKDDETKGDGCER